MKLKTQYRSFSIRAENVDKESRTIEFSFSSEEPVQRWFGLEILDHKKSSADFSRLNDGAPFLVGHRDEDLVGVVEKAFIKDKTGHAKIRFGNSERASEIMDDMSNNIRRNISFAYTVGELTLVKTGDGEDVFRSNSWMPYEISSVPVPADNTVGLGRSLEEGEEGGEEVELNGMELKETKEETKEETTEESKENKEEKTYSRDLYERKLLTLQLELTPAAKMNGKRN